MRDLGPVITYCKSSGRPFAAALESIAAVDDVTRPGGNYAAVWTSTSTPNDRNDVPPTTTRKGARRTRRAAEHMRGAFAAGVPAVPPRATWYVGARCCASAACSRNL